MPQLKRYNVLLVCGITLIGILSAWFYQNVFLPNGDVSWDILAAKRLIAGGTYTHDFFDLNPPLILYLYLPVVFIAKILSTSTVLALRIYILGLALFSLCICYFFIRRIFLKEHDVLSYVFYAVLTSLFLIYPGNDFGQREHLLLIFTLPYFLMVVYRLQGNSLNSEYAVGIGLFAVLGFALKPYFLIPLVFVEMYVIFYTRNVFAWLRVEVITIVVALVAYFAFVSVFYPDYISTLVPMAMRYYYAGFSQDWDLILANYIVYFCAVTALFYGAQYRKNPYKALGSVLLLAMVGFMMSYIIQRTAWSYHILPAVTMASLLMALLFGLFYIKHQKNVLLISLSAPLFFAIPFIDQLDKYFAAGRFEAYNQPLIAFLQTQAPHQPVYFISSSVNEQFPALAYTDSIYSSRFVHLFWMPAVVKNAMANPNHRSVLLQQQTPDELFFINMIAEDIETKKPKFVFVDVKEHKSYFSFLSFDYLPYLLKNSHFQAAWKPYHYLTTLEAPQLGSPNKTTLNLYLVQDIKQLRLEKIKGTAVILTGVGTNKTAYVVSNHQFSHTKYARFSARIKLTQHELLQLPKQDGKVNINSQNERLINQIVEQTTKFTVYKFHIYQRHEFTPKGMA